MRPFGKKERKTKRPFVQLLFAILTIIVVYSIYTALKLIILIDKSQIVLYTIISTILVVLLFIGVYWWVNRRESHLPNKKPYSIFKGIRLAVLMVVLIYFLQIILGLLQIAITGEQPDASANQKSIEDLVNNPSTKLFIVLSIVVAAPLMEELMFRRILIGKVPEVKTKFFYFRVLLSILTFAFAHVITEFSNGLTTSEIFAIATYLVISTIITFVYVRTGSIWYSICAHFLNNSIAAISLLSLAS